MSPLFFWVPVFLTGSLLQKVHFQNYPEVVKNSYYPKMTDGIVSLMKRIVIPLVLGVACTLAVTTLFLPTSSLAQETCGSIIQIENGEPSAEPIEDCEYPFGVPHINPDLEVFFGDSLLEGDSEYDFLDEERTLTIAGQNPDADYTFLSVYLHDGADLILQDGFENEESGTFETAGTYTLVVEEGQLILTNNWSPNWFSNLIALLIKTAYAFHGPAQVITFTVDEPEPEPEIDPLILQYEPILYLHPDEHYISMNVEAFVKFSSLWDDNGVLNDFLIKAESTTSPVTTDDLAANSDTSDWYLSFSGEGEPKTADPTLASNKYTQLVSEDEVVPTYYARRMDDSYTDDEGVKHDFIVLQYWFFYAFNDWAEHGGFNNHEGDWESVMVFLDKDTEEPQYVAYSAHHNDGDPSFNPLQYDSVRRMWQSNEIVKDGDHVNSFVAVGSHANYPNNGDDGIHIVPNIQQNYNDRTGINGQRLPFGEAGEVEVNLLEPSWIIYEGKWGADIDDVFGEKSGPQGPNYIDVGGTERFHHPVEWAGLADVAEKTMATSTDQVTFPSQKIHFQFSDPVESGTSLSVDLHNELISFGKNIGDTTLLPHFWDILSSLVNDTFTATVQLTYDQDELDQLGLDAHNLSVFLYNEDTQVWEPVSSYVDVEEHVISFTTTHFSRYALGIVEPPTEEELYDILHELVDQLQLRDREKKHLHNLLKISERLNNRDRRLANIASQALLRAFELQIHRYERKEVINKKIANKILNSIEILKGYLRV